CTFVHYLYSCLLHTRSVYFLCNLFSCFFPLLLSSFFFIFFFFTDTAPTEIYTLSLHDALPISARRPRVSHCSFCPPCGPCRTPRDRKSTRLNSSHVSISYAVFCLKKKKKKKERG